MEYQVSIRSKTLTPPSFASETLRTDYDLSGALTACLLAHAQSDSDIELGRDLALTVSAAYSHHYDDDVPPSDEAGKAFRDFANAADAYLGAIDSIPDPVPAET